AGGARLVFRFRGVTTHRVAIEQLAPAGRARLAILMDDLGSDRTAAEALFRLHLPVTLSILPFHSHSREIAREALAHGCEVMLHLPMQSRANESPEEQELRPGLSPDGVRGLVEKMLDAIPEADGVNNHQGSEATADNRLMQSLMVVLKDEGVFYVDSRTTAATVAFDAAKHEGVPTAFRNVPFLDDVQNKEAVRRQLKVAIERARGKGEAIAIGHPHPETLAALRELLPQAGKSGVDLVLVSELVH
ncbi:MAG TPA: divergent polysaccharide deacetylase family protein, partial [Candidatus Acidoferrum sp.]|nr:divergent polysaccharide deacetylase family protein [Candidatus Acidoferrum sp.]